MKYFSKVLFFAVVLAVSSVVNAWADINPLYRYVRPANDGGAYTNDGLSWGSAKSNIQDAINELHDYMTVQGITEGGYVFVRHGVYKPTESTDQVSQLPQYLSFKIYSGINVWGGWAGTEDIPAGATDDVLFDLEPKVVIQGPSGAFVLNQFETILDGNLSDDQNAEATFVWSNERQRYVTTFPSNVYHVVTFATNGFDANGHARPLAAKASVNVCTIRGGRAYNSDASLTHPYNAYGGGVYMVGNTEMHHSRVSECEASRDGGGVYLDGGGNFSHGIVTDCQALGLGIQFGRGGGICIDQAGTVEQSYMLNNVAREGAGLGVYYNATVAHTINPQYHTYSAICKSSLIANNTATTEAGGIYMDGGGVLDGVTVARNRCNGVGALINNIMTGQSAGVFMVGPARAYNSAFWGGQIGATASMEDLQFAAYNNGQDSQKSLVAYVALNNNDLVNWSYSSTKSIISLAGENLGDNTSLNYAAFQGASPQAGVLPKLKETLVLARVKDFLSDLVAKGVYAVPGVPEVDLQELDIENLTYARITPFLPVVITQMTSMYNIRSTVDNDFNAAKFMADLTDGMFYVASYSFKPSAVSSLAGAGVQLSDLKAEPGVDLSAAELTKDILDINYSPLCDLGAYNALEQQTNHATTINYIESGAANPSSTLTLFVDPDRASSASDTNIGSSWDTPYKYLRDALRYITQYRQKLAAYQDSVTKSLSPHNSYTDFAHYQILVKEGTVYTAATHINEHISHSSIYMVDGVSVYGGFPREFTGTSSVSQDVNGVNLRRNPVVYPTIISGSFSDEGYETNVGHLVNFCSINNAILDGFQLRYGNATGTLDRNLGTVDAFDGGGGIVITNAFRYDGNALVQNAPAEIRSISGNQIRNCVITGCTGRMGAAVLTYAPLNTLQAKFENCIFHNNNVLYGTDQTVADLRDAGKEYSIIRAVRGANLTFNHCDIIRNVGVGIDAQEGATLVLNNSVFYANLDRSVQNTNGFNEIQPGQTGFAKMCAPIVNGGATISGHNNRFDYLFGQAETPAEEANRDKYRFSGDLMINLAMIGSGSSNNISNLTYNSSNNPNFTYPLFKNATRNAGLSVEGDITFFGGVTDWMPNAMSPLVNVGLAGVSNTDISVVNDRSFGGSPDVGAVENSVDQPHNPSSKITEGPVGNPTATYTNLATYYVRDYGSDHTKGGDGSSWSSAINGNANYDLISGNLAANAAGSAIVEEMVDSNDPDPLNQYTSVSTYRLYNRDSQMYMSGGGLGTSDQGLAMEFVFIKTTRPKVTYWNAIEVPVYKFYYFLTQRVADKVYSKTENSVTTLYYWDGSKMYDMDSKTEVGTSTVGYAPVYETIEINSEYYTLYQKTIAGDVVYYYLKDDHYWKVEDNSDCGTDGSGYERVWQEVNVTYTRQPVGYLRFVPNGDTYDIGNTSDVNAASEFVLSGTPDSLYVSPLNALSLGPVGLTMSNAGGFWHASVGAQIDGSYAPMTNATWAISVIGSANKYSFLGYRLRSKNAVNTVPAGTYVSLNTTNVAITNKITAVSLKGTTVEAEREVVKFDGQINHNDGKLTAKLTTNNNKGFGYASTKINKVDTYYFNLLPQSSDWIVSLDPEEKAYRVHTSDNKAYSTWAKTADRNPVTYLSLATTGEEILWTLEPVYQRESSSNTVNGLQYAIMCANKAAIADNKTHEIWVAEGTYTKASEIVEETIDGVALKFHTTYKLLEGASLYGGFPKVGNPTMKERNPKQYETFLQTTLGHDAKDKNTYGDYDKVRTVGRVLYQANDFAKETHVDGFTIRYGYLNQAFRSPINNNLENIINDGGAHQVIKPHISVGMSGGAGALIRTGLVLENCKVTQNMCYYNSFTRWLFISRTQTGEDFDASVAQNKANVYHVAGGGVSSLGATIRNCEIVDNRISMYRSANSSNCTYGAGLFMSSGSVYNTVISGNDIEGVSTIDIGGSSDDIRAGAGVYLHNGNFFNNTVVDNSIIYGASLSATLGVCVYIPAVFVHSDVTMYNTIIANNNLSGNFGRYTVNNKLIYGYPVACLGDNWAMSPGKIRSFNSCIYTGSQTLWYGSNKNSNQNTLAANEYGEQVLYNQTLNNGLCLSNIFVNPNLDANYHEQVGSPTINKGMENIPSITIPEYDAAYETRIQDCQIDMGAYEHNSASNVTPTVSTVNEVTTAVYYVNAGGVGNATATNAANAACVEKLQKVLDAAGRYRYQNPTHQVEVRLAGYASPTASQYYHPLRPSDPSQADNVRSWSLMVPRGVTVIGGFAEDFAGTQDVLGNQTILDGGYKTTSGETTHAYHVVTFTDRVFDADGAPYLVSDASKVSTGAASSFAIGLSTQVVDDATLLKLPAGKAVLNGLFIQNGNADGIASNTSATKTYTGYGGAAIVPSYASIRNCIIQNNNALYGGGGLYLQQGATVCGVLIKNNTAKMGGGVYFEELSRTPSWRNFSTVPAELVQSTVMQFAQLVNSTVTGNTATGKGGGIYFQNNAHVMSSAIWGNNCGDMANVAGQTNAYSFASANEITFAKYPFCYSAVENNRLPGANNISVATDNSQGVRFLDVNHLDDLNKFAQTAGDIDPFYRLSDFSQLAKGGSSVQSFMLAVQVFGATTSDYAGVARVSPGFDYVDIGATAIQQEPKNAQDITTILPRLYVAQAKDIDKEAQQAMIQSGDPIYSQKGSSFAYPFQSLDEALEYIRNLRKKVSDDNHVAYTEGDSTKHYVWEYARNIPFEIIMAKGIYYPTRDIYNVQGESLGNTFLVPEGVSIVGGFDVRELATVGGKKRFYGQKYKPLSHTSDTYAAVPDAGNDNIAELMAANLQALAEDSTVVGSTGCRMIQLPIEAMKSPRAHADNNVNNVIEPWEFTYQTVLSGKVINSDEAANAYHVVTVIADETLVGALPVGYDYSDYSPVDIPERFYKVGMRAKEKGAPVELNGVQISDGQAYRYSQTAANGYVWMDYYHGGGLMIDGNWYRTYNNDGTVDKKYQNQNVSNSVGYRNIPVIVDRCHFTNNKGGYGGAISSNSDINMSNNSFTSNQAIAYKDAQVAWSVDGEAIQADKSNASRGQPVNGQPALPYTNIYYPGNGGAIYSTKQLIAANCIFENNEATNTYNAEPTQFKSPRSGGAAVYQYGGCGGAVYSGSSAIVMFFNCNFVRNKANMYPCIFARYPNHFRLDMTHSVKDPSQPITEPGMAYNRAFGCVFWGNEGTNTAHSFSANQVFASAPVISDVELATGVPNTLQGAYQLLPDNNQSLTVSEWQAIFDANYAQSLWFCAFEEHTHMTPHRDYDVRLSGFRFDQFVERTIRNYVYETYIEKGLTRGQYDALFDGTEKGNTTYNDFVAHYVLQDYNQIIHSDNSHINGPNFTKPSNSAGLAGYMQDADWMPKRINRLTDNGWGYIVQKTSSDNIIDGVIFDKNNEGSYNGNGAFFTVLNSNKKFQKYVAMGDETYMLFDAKNVTDESTSKSTINRISKMPTPTVPTFDNQESYAYIDIGVFEFQHQRLGRPLGDVDYIWVAPAEKPENGGAIGTSWLRPTSDIQRAIETLLSNRNGHKKYLYIIEGDYKPFYNLTPAAGSSMDYNAGFTINTENLNSVALSPTDRCGNGEDDMVKQFVPSLTIIGGFSKEVQTTMKEKWGDDVQYTDEGTYTEEQKKTKELKDYYAPEDYRDAESFPTVFFSDNGTSHTLFDIVDARQWLGRAGAGNLAPKLDGGKLIPIAIDGISFNNSSAAGNPLAIADAAEGKLVGSAINYATIEKFNNPKVSYTVNENTSSRAAGCSYTITNGTPRLVSGEEYELVMNADNLSLQITLYQNMQQGERITVVCSREGTESGFGVKVSDGTNTETLIIPAEAASEEEREISFDIPAGFVGKHELTITRIDGKEVTLKAVYLYGKKKEAVGVVAPASGAPKLTISNCRFYGNGVDSQDIPAVNIASAGGKSLIYNSLFHHNNGTAVVGDNVTLVNNTIALNTQGVALTNNGGNSEMHGNVLWNNTTEYTLPDALTAVNAANFTFNAVKGANPETAWTAGQHNTHLGDTNDDIQNGPNFVDPENGDFHLKPSIKLLNAMKDGSSDMSEVYYRGVTGASYPVKNEALDTDSISSFWNNEKDLQFKYRLVDEYMDLGAYEYQNKLMGYAFYNPNVNKSGDGTTWEKAYGFGNLQNAIDLVAVATKGGAEFGYVFAKGGRDGKSTGENVIMRNGVQVYGSIATSYVKEPEKEDVNGEPTVTVATISEYSIDLRTQRPGMAGPSTDRTIVNNVSSTTGTTTNNTVFDGFEVTGSVNMHPATEGDMLFSNSIVCSSPKNGGVNLSEVSNTLVYNSLFRGEYTQLRLANNYAYAVNVTSEKPLLIYDEGQRTDQIVNCRDNVTPTRILVDESDNVMDPNLEFQLAEEDTQNYDQGVSRNEAQIQDENNQEPLDIINRLYKVTYDIPTFDGSGNMIKDGEGKPVMITMTNYPLMFDDRDLLGNPRRLGGQVDKGAFESWRVSGDVHLNYQETVVNGSVVAKKRNFPHEGSFVYMATNSNLILDASLQENKTLVNGVPTDADIDPSSGKATIYAHPEYPIMPGYVMMHKGASIYGQGNALLISKITVEKEVNKYGEVIALPFDMKYLTGTDQANTPTVATYNGDRRALRESGYGNGWDVVGNSDYVVPANQAVRFEPYGRNSDLGANAEVSDFIDVKFTASGKNLTDYAYIEVGPTKTVQLTSHDEYGTTTAQDMGWNCFGSPFLIANFNTRDYDSGSKKYSMHVPHKMYQYHYPVNGSGHVTGDGDYREVTSWAKYDPTGGNTLETEPILILGEGVFTQTATFADAEDLVFRAPTFGAAVRPAPQAAPAARAVIYRHEMPGEEDEEIDESIGDAIVVYVKHSELHVEGLQGGERITVCGTDGRTEHWHIAEEGETEFVTFVTPGAHVVRVNNQSVVVMNVVK